MNRILLAIALLALLVVPATAQDSSYAPGSNYMAQGGNAWYIGGSLVILDGATLQSSGGTAGTGVAVVETFPAVRTATLTFTLTGANDVDVEDGGKTKGVKIFDFPQGHIIILGAVINASITAGGTFSANPADVYYVGVGSADGTQAANADLTSTEQNIIAKQTLDTASGGTLTHAVQTLMGTLAYADNIFDGHTTATALYLNVAVPADNASTATTHAVTGSIKVTYANLGDY